MYVKKSRETQIYNNKDTNMRMISFISDKRIISVR